MIVPHPGLDLNRVLAPALAMNDAADQARVPWLAVLAEGCWLAECPLKLSAWCRPLFKVSVRVLLVLRLCCRAACRCKSCVVTGDNLEHPQGLLVPPASTNDKQHAAA